MFDFIYVQEEELKKKKKKKKKKKEKKRKEKKSEGLNPDKTFSESTVNNSRIFPEFHETSQT